MNVEQVTLDYVETEDRIRLSTRITGGDLIAIWLTARLARRLLTYLLGNCSLESQPAPQIADVCGSDGESQDEAVLPIRCPVGCDSYLTVAIDIQKDDSSIRLTFRGEDPSEDSTLLMSPPKAYRLIAALKQSFETAGWEWRGLEKSSAIARQRYDSGATLH